MDWTRVARDWAARVIDVESLPDIAADALASGDDSRWLRQLAGLSEGDLSEAPDLLARCFSEREVVVPSEGEALRVIGLDVVARMSSGSLDFIVGVRELLHLEPPDPQGFLKRLASLLDTYDEFESDPGLFWRLMEDPGASRILMRGELHSLASAWARTAAQQGAEADKAAR